MMNRELLIAIEAALEAGKEILKVYNDPNSDFEVERKSDNSPLTIADKKAHVIISRKLKSLNYSILSEEGDHANFLERKSWSKLWIVDPLDGTKEFIKRNGEFTVNIALLEKGVPQLGVIYIPVERKLYYSDVSCGAYVMADITIDSEDWKERIAKGGMKLPIANASKEKYTVVASRSHLSNETKAYITELEAVHKDVVLVSAGSSIKICWVADGTADIYPRFAPTMEWDTAAGHAICLGAGKQIVLASDEETPLKYNKEDLLNPWFIVK